MLELSERGSCDRTHPCRVVQPNFISQNIGAKPAKYQYGLENKRENNGTRERPAAPCAEMHCPSASVWPLCRLFMCTLLLRVMRVSQDQNRSAAMMMDCSCQDNQ